MITAISTATAGLATASAQFDKAATAVAASGTSGGPSDTVDLSAAAVQMMSAQTGVALNVAMLKAATDMQARLIDLLA